jgi:hypothetical protein
MTEFGGFTCLEIPTWVLYIAVAATILNAVVLSFVLVRELLS